MCFDICTYSLNQEKEQALRSNKGPMEASQVVMKELKEKLKKAQAKLEEEEEEEKKKRRRKRRRRRRKKKRRRRKEEEEEEEEEEVHSQFILMQQKLKSSHRKS